MDYADLLVFVFPAYVANAVPVLFAGKTPIDLGEHLEDGHRFFGKGKTVRGFIAGVAAGTVTGAAMAFLQPGFLPFLASWEKTALAFLLGVGTMLGDLAGSFLKRRLRVPSGGKIRFLDQIPFVLIALLFAVLAFPQLAVEIGLTGLGFLVVVTLVLHRLVNWVAHAAGLKNVPW